MNNSIVISFRIDAEIQSYINYLKKNNINHSHIIRESIREKLRLKCKEFNYKQNKEYLPF